MSLTDNEIRIVSLIEQRFWETGYLATNETVAQDLKIGVQLITKAWKKPEFRQALIARGVDLDTDATAGVLTPVQIVLANMLLNAHDKRSIREKLETVNVTSQQYNAWMRQPAFSQYLRLRAEKAFAGHDHVAYTTLMKAIEDGDVTATMKFFEMRGIYNPKVQVEVNVEQVIVYLVEIVARHVTDPNVLQAIAEDIERIDLKTGRPVALPVGSTEVASPVRSPELTLSI